jgi:DNA-binding winged helix-turn-helix (wHTH) protein/tetratricopeptide (TPR) repeat protein
MASPIHLFGDCSVDVATRELRRDGELVTLSPKVFDCLAYLIQHRDRAVGRDELIAAVWGKVDVTDTLLGQTVLKARRSVGDTGNAQQAIRTIPRFGYRWVAPIDSDANAGELPEPVPAAAPAPPEAGAPATHPDSPRIASAPVRGRRGLVALVLVVAGAAYALWWMRPMTTLPQPATATPAQLAPTARDMAAVLPVAVDADARWSWLRLGLMDLIAGRLRSAGQAVVPSDNVVALARGADGAATMVARMRKATGARHVVAASATLGDGGWLVRLDLDSGAGPGRAVEARNADPTTAARQAADRLLAVLGRRAPDPGSDPLALPASELLARTESAVLSDDIDGARRLLDSASPELRRSSQFGLRLGQVEYRAGQFDAAHREFESLLGEVGAETDPVLRGRILNGLGAVAMRQDRTADAARAYEAAVELLSGHDQPAALGQAYTGRGVTHASAGRYDLALADFSRARITLQLAGDALALARIDANEGVIDSQRGRFDDALAINLRAAARFEQFGALTELVSTLGNAAEANLALLQPRDALATLARADPALRQLQNAHARHGLEVVRATALIANGQNADARTLLASLADSVPHDGDKPLLARLASARAMLALGNREPAQAAQLAAAAVPALAGHDYRRDRIGAWLLLTRALRAAGRTREATTQVAQLRAWAAAAPDSSAPLYATLASAEQYWASRDIPRASAAFDQALADAEQRAVPIDLAEVVVAYGSRLIGSGELERAGAVVGQVSRWADRDFRCAVLQARFYQALGRRAAWQGALKSVLALAGERPLPAGLTKPPPAAPAGPAPAG